MTNRTGCLLLMLAQAAAGPQFEVASVKPSTDCLSGGRGGRVGAPTTLSPARLDLRCETVEGLIQLAYVTALQPPTAIALPREAVTVSGGPAWIRTERFDIEAKAEGAPGPKAMRGPMLQALLEDRFHLKIHRETKEEPVYFLSVAKGGAKRLQPAQEGKCLVFDHNDPQAPRPGSGTRGCGLFYPSPNHDGSDVFGITMADLCRQMSVFADRTVIDHTGIAGRFDIHFDTPPLVEPAAPPPSLVDLIVSALNLKLESGKGATEVLVIDGIERHRRIRRLRPVRLAGEAGGATAGSTLCTVYRLSEALQEFGPAEFSCSYVPKSRAEHELPILQRHQAVVRDSPHRRPSSPTLCGFRKMVKHAGEYLEASFCQPQASDLEFRHRLQQMFGHIR